MKSNIILMTDSYKFTHWKQYPPRTRTVYSYMESRGGQFDEIVFFGLQYYLKEYLCRRITWDDIDEAEEFIDMHFGRKGEFNRAPWEKIVHRYSGRLPIMIKALDEGTVVPQLCVQFTIENTDPDYYWLPNYLETLLSKVWYPCVVASNSRACKKEIIFWHNHTGSDKSGIDFKLHDFGYRGVASEEQAGIGGLAHLTQFKGTDTVRACLFGRDYYDEPMAGFSIPASEHSTITSWGKNNELEAVRNMLDKYPTGPVACVADSYDVFNWFSKITGTDLRDRIIERDGVFIGRPDSGTASEVVPKCINIWGNKFGGLTNTPKGYSILHPKVAMIQGDGIVGINSIREIYSECANKGWAAQNLAFGSGGGLLQKFDRDTNMNAIKCSAAYIDEEWRDVYKDPITDKGKVSKKGIQYVYDNNGILATTPTFRAGWKDKLQPCFYNGDLTNTCTLTQVRNRSNVS